jgi:glycosyltransferase involved in cell wall biosynthesis
MRIGMVSGEYPPMQGGVGAYTHILAQELVAQGAKVHLFSAPPAESADPALPLTRTASGWNVRSLFQIRAWASQLDLINIQFQTAAYQMSPWIHVLPDVVRSVPVVCTFHDLRAPYLFPKAGLLRQWMVKNLAARCRGVIVTNHEDQQQIATHPHHRLIPIGSNILTHLDPAFDVSAFRTQVGLSAADFVVGYFGLINHSKGLEDLIQAVKTLCAEHVAITVVMIGGGSGSSDPSNVEYMTHIQTEIEAAGIQDRVRWTGYLDEEQVAYWLRSCDVIALPFRDGASYRRGSLMAAIHYGCAIVTTTPTVAIPSFETGNTMHLVPARDALALAEGLRRLYSNPSYGITLRQGVTALRSQFAWSRIAADTLAFFTEVA